MHRMIGSHGTVKEVDGPFKTIPFLCIPVASKKLGTHSLIHSYFYRHGFKF